MKHLIISEIALVSDRDRKARRIEFDPTRTVLLGANQTGKSSLIKAIYHALGAEPAKQDQRWINGEVKSLIKFTVDGEGYLLTRDHSFFALFRRDLTVIGVYTNIVGGLSPVLAEIFDFKLILASRDQTAEIPPPAFLYLPYYVDQDASWQNAWSGFARLQQYAAWKTSVADYHTGSRDNRYYELQADEIEKQRRFNEAQHQVSGLETVIKKLSDDSRQAGFDLDPKSFGDKVDQLLREAEVLAGQESTLKEQLATLNSQRVVQRSRLEIAKRALGEIGKDFNFLASLPTEEIECPTCGTEYSNDFAARFAIASDEDRVAVFIEQIRAEIENLDRSIQSVYQNFRVASEQAEKIQVILAEKQGELTFGQVIESEGRKAADNLLQAQLETVKEERDGAATLHVGAKSELKAHSQRLEPIEADVKKDYARLLRKNLSGLAVNPLSVEVYGNIAPIFRETGSSLPRALLAYYFTIFELAAARTPATVCPFVIDSPNQQAQDDASLKIMLEFIAKNQPSGTQMILAVEKTMDVELGGKLIELTDKYNLLQASEYADVRAEFTELTRRIVS